MNKKTMVGGQALIEGIMMKGGEKTAVSVRVPSGDIETEYIEQPYVIAHNLWELSEGKIILSNTDKTTRYTVVLTASTKEELDARLADVPYHIHVWVENKNGMEEAIWR